MNAKGTVYKYGDDVNTDVIIPARYLNTASHAELASHCMEDIDKDFVKNVKPGDVVVAGKNFGCGSSREHAPIALKASQVSCVIAKTFARIFYRNSINIGFPILECPEAAEEIQPGDVVSVDFDSGLITDETTAGCWSPSRGEGWEIFIFPAATSAKPALRPPKSSGRCCGSKCPRRAAAARIKKNTLRVSGPCTCARPAGRAWRNASPS